jgi:hypothetical protein
VNIFWTARTFSAFGSSRSQPSSAQVVVQQLAEELRHELSLLVVHEIRVKIDYVDEVGAPLHPNRLAVDVICELALVVHGEHLQRQPRHRQQSSLNKLGEVRLCVQRHHGPLVKD